MEKRQRKRFQHRNIDEGQMKDPNPLSDQNPAPEDVATLYSWANLHGAKYRDFSAARAQTREKARLRAEQALEEEQGGGPMETTGRIRGGACCRSGAACAIGSGAERTPRGVGIAASRGASATDRPMGRG